ncbi:MAG: hypothetical protein ACTHOU_15970, partial [Aureliella sp.]
MQRRWKLEAMLMLGSLCIGGRCDAIARADAPAESVLQAQQAREAAMARASQASIAVFGLDGGG